MIILRLSRHCTWQIIERAVAREKARKEPSRLPRIGIDGYELCIRDSCQASHALRGEKDRSRSFSVDEDGKSIAGYGSNEKKLLRVGSVYYAPR